MRFGISVAALPLLLASCASSPPSGKIGGEPAVPARSPAAAGTLRTDADARAVVRSIVPCVTTEAELRRQLGEPSRDGILHGERLMTWIFRTETPSRYIGVLIDRRGVVADLYWDVPTEVPWVPTNQCAGR